LGVGRSARRLVRELPHQRPRDSERIMALTCTSCKTRAEVLAHQIRGRQTFIVCLDCADRYYQDQLTRQLIANEKAGA